MLNCSIKCSHFINSLKMPYANLHFALFGNVHQTKKNQFVAAILVKLTKLGVKISIEEDFAQFIQNKLNFNVTEFDTFKNDRLDKDIDIAVSIGGDGTFLGTASKIGVRNIPIIGVNTGHLGFLADVSPQSIDESFEALCKGNYIVEERKTLGIKVNGKLSDFHPYALNEAAVLKHDISSLIEIKTYVDDKFLTNYLADGLIVSTPTGSTGYSLSVGGPILVPQSGTFCISPVAPHSLSVRPVVVRDDVEIRMEVRSRSHNFLLSCDGRSESLPNEAVITVCKAPHTIKVIKIQHKNFFDTLREKLMWGVDQRI